VAKRSEKQPAPRWNESVDDVVELCLRILSHPRHEISFGRLCQLLSPSGLRAWEATLEPELVALLRASAIWAEDVTRLQNCEVSQRRSVAKSLANTLLDLRRKLYFEAIERARGASHDPEFRKFK
jgi:hypothetical protein